MRHTMETMMLMFHRFGDRAKTTSEEPGSPHGKRVPFASGKSKGPSGCEQNNEERGSILRWHSGPLKCFVTSRRTQHPIKWLFCSAPEAEGEEKAESHTEALFPHWREFSSRVTWERCLTAFVNRSGPPGIVQITLSFRLTRRERKVYSMTEAFLVFIVCTLSLNKERLVLVMEKKKGRHWTFNIGLCLTSLQCK